MARDENDSPDLTGDVLSDRWTPESADTDEQPAVVAEDKPPAPAPAAAPAPAPAPAPAAEADEVPLVTVLDAPPVVAMEVPETEAQYLPLDQGFDSAGESSPRGFLGSGWTEDGDAPEREVRRRTRLLLAGAAAVVVVGAAGGWMLIGSGGEACAGGSCASSRSVAPAVTVSPVEEPASSEPAVEPVTDPSQTPESSATVSAIPEPPTRVRQSKAPQTPRPTATRLGTPTTKPSSRPVRTLNDETVKERTNKNEPATEPTAEPTTQAPPATGTEAPAPATEAPAPVQQPPSDDRRSGGLLDWLFG
ncbi:hypothetical protein [Nonomuraea sp. NPDC003804]|uniref:hypothetical protein n=1 Tax=Nonomuraea sp. NPDC003804 TaxID=3154547 RepID=UPI0033AC3769